MSQREPQDEIEKYLGLPKMPNCEGREVLKVGFPHRRQGYMWGAL